MQQLPQFVTPTLTQLPSSGEAAPALPTLSPPEPVLDLALNRPHRYRRNWTGRTSQQAVRAEPGIGQKFREFHGALEALGKRIEALERTWVGAVHLVSFIH